MSEMVWFLPTDHTPKEFTCNGAHMAPALHAKVLAAPNCTVLAPGLCMLPCGSIVSESVFDAVRGGVCTSECLLVGTPEVCVPAPRLQGLSAAPRRVLTTPVKEDAPRVKLWATTVLIMLGVFGSVLVHARAGWGVSASNVRLLG